MYVSELVNDVPTYTRIEDHVVAVPDDLGHGLGVGHPARDLHLLVLLHLHLGARQVVQDLDTGGRHCNGQVQIFFKYTKYFPLLQLTVSLALARMGGFPLPGPTYHYQHYYIILKKKYLMFYK